MAIIETEVWKPHPDNSRALIFDSQRVAQDVFNELEAHLKADGRLPDEYFNFDAWGNWKNGALFPKDGEILCNVNYGGSEGVWLDISLSYKKDVYERNQNNGELGWVNRNVIEHFATGKTLGDSIEDLDRMNLVASSVMAAFYGSERQIRERYAKIESGEIKPVYPIPSTEQQDTENLAEVRKPQASKTDEELSVQGQLYEKMSEEYRQFLEGLKGLPPDKVIESSYEKVFKEDLLLCCEDENIFTDEQAKALLECDYPLDYLYHEWLDSDASYMDMLEDCIDQAVELLISAQDEPEERDKNKSGTVKVPEQSAEPPKKSLEERMQAAQIKADAHNAQHDKNKTTKKELE
jgi:hypothetical protein